MGLDVLGLYEAAADKFFDDAHYDRALSYDEYIYIPQNLLISIFLFRLYHLSNVDSSKLISKFAAKGRMEDVIAHLVLKLRMRESTLCNIHHSV